MITDYKSYEEAKAKFTWDEAWEFTDGGYLASGNAFGGCGLPSIVETVIQLRDETGPRQVPNVKIGLCQSADARLNAFVSILKS